MVEQSDEKEVLWLEKAAKSGDAFAINTLGCNYIYGKGVEKDIDKAIAMFRKAARKKSECAALNLAICYKNGEGVEKNLKESLRWYRLAQRWCFELDYFELQKDIDDLKRQIKEQQ